MTEWGLDFEDDGVEEGFEDDDVGGDFENDTKKGQVRLLKRYCACSKCFKLVSFCVFTIVSNSFTLFLQYELIYL